MGFSVKKWGGEIPIKIYVLNLRYDLGSYLVLNLYYRECPKQHGIYMGAY
jgi:hypothetical protein